MHVSSHHLGAAGGIFEVAAYSFLELLAGVHQPENDEQRHHGGDEICVSDFPCATVMSGVANFSFNDDAIGHGYFSGVTAAAAALPCLQAFSISMKDGRKRPGIARRANSRALIGALPLMNESKRTRRTW